MTTSPNTPIAATAVDYDPFAETPLARVVPTTAPQREVWLADRLGREASLAYNEAVSFLFAGTLNVPALQSAIQGIVLRHDALRATLSANGEELLISDATTLQVPVIDMSGWDHDSHVREIADAKRRAVETPFDLTVGPLFRAEIVKLGDTSHCLVIAAHHIVCDGWSYGVIANELAALYAAQVGRTVAPLPAPTSFAEYAADRDEASEGVAEQYWVSQFVGTPPVLDLPSDRQRATWRTFTSRREDVNLDATLITGLRKAGASSGAGLFATLLGTFASLLARLTSADDVVIGVPAAGQSQGEYASLVGHCVHLLPLRLSGGVGISAKAHIASTQSALLQAMEHQNLTFGTLLTKLSIPRDPSRLPLVSVMFNLDQVLDANALGFPDVSVDFSSIPRRFENFELFVNAVQVDGGLRLECQYNADLFDQTTIQRWFAAYEQLLRAVQADGGQKLDGVSLLTESDRHALETWNATQTVYRSDALVHQLFEEQAERVPDHSAIRFAGGTTTYHQLNAEANQIAHCLRQRGVSVGDLVGIHVRRGPGMIAALLGVLKVGAAYVPLDPSYPANRLAFMAEQAALALLITEVAIADGFGWPVARSLRLDTDRDLIAAQPTSSLVAAGISPESRAYVIFTSGSTGKPKGVQVPHRAVVNFLQSMAKKPGITDADRVVAVTTLSFDIAVNEILTPLSVGAEVILATSEEAGDGTALTKLIDTSAATMLQATPATWRLLLAAGWRGAPSLKALCGGEALTTDLVLQLLPRVGSLWNMYGPTETTVWSTATRIEDSRPAITIGRPIDNTTIYVLDEARNCCPIGVPGEIWIGGVGVTLGYLGREDLTAERFIADPFAKNSDAKLYRTGDRGRWRADGTIEHLGRLDFQVKVRGYRIELGEIEAALCALQGVQQAVVVVREDVPNDVRLVAYIVCSSERRHELGTLRAALGTSLPLYMVPQHFVPLEKIPLLPNGKVNRAGLPKPNDDAVTTREIALPKTELERILLGEMEAAIGLPGLGIDSDFFAHGGHSLTAARFAASAAKRLSKPMMLKDVFLAPTVRQLAARIETAVATSNKDSADTIEWLEDRAEAPMSPLQEPIWLMEQFQAGGVTYNTPSAHRLRGPLNEQAFEQAFAEIVQRQSVLRTSFEQRGGTAVQKIAPTIVVPLFPAESLVQHPASRRESLLVERLGQLAAESISLATAPLFRAKMFKLSDDEHVFFFMPHHVIWDGWSFDIFYEEFSALYAAYCCGAANPLPALPVSYGDFSAWHRKRLMSDEIQQQLTYWRDRLKSFEGAAPFWEASTKTMHRTGAAQNLAIFIAHDRVAALHALAKELNTTAFVVTMSVFYMLLFEQDRNTRLIVSTPVRGRNRGELENVMGLFTVLLPLTVHMNGDETFAAFVSRMRAMAAESFSYADVSQDMVARSLPFVQKNGGELFKQALFSFQDARHRSRNWDGLKHEFVPLMQNGATHDLGLWFLESVDGLHGGLIYSTDRFTDASAQALKNRYEALLDAALARRNDTVAGLLGMSDMAPTNALEQVAPGQDAVGTGATAPAAALSATEAVLASVWSEVLNTKNILPQDNFFDLGGHSLLAMQAILAMEAKTGKRVDRGRYIFDTLAQIARAYDEAETVAAEKPGGLRGLLSGIFGGSKR